MIQIPNPILVPDQLSNLLKHLNINNFHEAIEWVWKLPYGRNSNRSNYFLIPIEKKGTCSTKHAFLAALAQEQIIPFSLNIGMFMMNENNTPGVGDVLESYGLTEIPEAHCYLKYLEKRYDFTFYNNVEDCTSKLKFIYEREIKPNQIDDFKINLHRNFLIEWSKNSRLRKNIIELWMIREKCIQMISNNKIK